MIQIHEHIKKICAKYYGITEEELVKKISDTQHIFIEEWNSKKDITEFYVNTKQYVYDLVKFNNDFRLNTLLYPLQFFRDKKILDYGGGIGVVSTILDSFNTVYYYDINVESIKFAKFINSEYKGNVNFINSEEEAFEKDIDCVVCVDVLEHLEKPMETVKKITEKLPKNGLFLTTGLNFSIGDHIPMHLPQNREYLQEYTEYMKNNYTLIFYHSTCNEMIYLWSKK